MMENRYSIQGYTIEGLSRLQNTRHEIKITPNLAREARQCHKYTEEEKDQVLRLVKDGYFNNEISEMVGIPVNAVRRIKERGIGRRTIAKISESEREEIKAIYATTITRDIAEMYDITYDSLQNYANSHGWKKCEGYGDIVKNRRKEAATKFHRDMSEAHRKGIVSKANATKSKIFEQEKRRLTFGMQQQTKVRVSRMSEKKRAFRGNMHQKRGYILAKKQPDLMYYDANTKRSDKLEEKARNMGIEIKEI